MRAGIGSVLIVVSLGFAGQAVASNDTWTNASGDSLWSNAANWSTGAIPTANDVVFFDPDFSHGGGVVDLGGTAQSAQSIDFQATTSSTIFQLKNGTLITNFIGFAPGEQFISVNLSTTSNLLDVGSNGSGGYSGVIGGNGVGRNDFGLLAEGGVFTASNTYTGMTYINSDVPVVLTGANGSFSASSGIYMNGGTLELDNRSAVNGDRVGNNAPINCLKGTITLDGNATSATGETIGTVTLSGTKLNLNVYSNGAPAALTINSLARSGSAVLQLSLAPSAGAIPGKVLIQNAASLPLVGAGGTAGSTNQSILPYAIGDGSSFVTYDFGPDGKPGTADDVGLRPLDVSNEYLPAIPTGTTSTGNVRIAANQSLSQSDTINALAISNATLTIPNSQQLQLTSGALSLSGTSTQLTPITGGSVNFSGREAVIYTDGLASGTQPRYVVDSQLQNASSITKFGAGTLVLTQPSSFAGTLTIQEGMVGSQANGALGSGKIVVGQSAGLNSTPIGIAFESVNQTFSNSISDAFNSSSSITISVADGLQAAYGGAISSSALKVGTGILSLTPACSVINPNGPSGFGINGGTLRVDTTAAQMTFTVGLFPGDTATLGGNGTVNTIRLWQYGILSPGAAGQVGSDILSTTNLWMYGGTFHVALNGTIPGVQYDQVDVAGMTAIGSISITDSVDLDVALGYNAHVGDQFTIINDAAGAQLSGNFAGLPEGAVFSADGDQFQITYQGGDGNDVVLTVLSTPEPSAITFATACLAGLLLRRRARGRDVRG